MTITDFKAIHQKIYNIFKLSNSMLSLIESGKEFDDAGYSISHMAANENRIELIHFLHNNNSLKDIGIYGEPDKPTPLYLAAWRGNMDIIEFLLSVGHSTTPLANNVTLVDCAANSGSLEAVSYFQNLGFSVHNLTLHGENLLHSAARNMNATPLITYLTISEGLDVDKQDHLGYTPLHVAIDVGSIMNIKALLDVGAKIDIKNIYGQSPYQLALSTEREDIIGLFSHLTKTLISSDINEEEQNLSLTNLENLPVGTVIIVKPADPSYLDFIALITDTSNDDHYVIDIDGSYDYLKRHGGSFSVIGYTPQTVALAKAKSEVR